jgi:UDP-glucose-4-epimerase GalE
MSNILVTGGAGYIGSHTAKALAASGHCPVVLDNLSKGHKSAVRWGPLVEADLADRPALDQVMREYRIEGVIHFAAHAYVGESMATPNEYFRNNVSNTLNLLDAMLAAGVCRFIFSSTCAVYGNPLRVPITEDHPREPVNPYGESKLFVEKALRWYGRAFGLAWVALRYFNAAGADPEGDLGEDHRPETHLVPLVIQTALGQRECVRIFGTDYPTPDGTAVRDYIHVSDLASAHLAALAYLKKGGEARTFNLGTGTGYSVRQVIAQVEACGGRRVATHESPRRAGDPPVLIADSAQAGEALGWEPMFSSLDSIVSTAWAWHARCAAGRSRLNGPKIAATPPGGTGFVKPEAGA